MKRLRLTPASLLLLCYFLYLCLITSWHTLQWPIVADDTDLWFHLTGGRYVMTHHALPPDSFFSFLSPPRAWVDYAWLFQVVAYAIYSSGHYAGFIVLRTAVFLLLMAVIALFLFRRRDPDASRLYLAMLLVVYWFFLLPRYLLVRPRIFTYLWTALFLWVFEDHPRWMLALLAVGIVWCNLHGITYPVMVLLGGAYLLEYVVTRPGAGTERWRLTSCMYAVLVMATIFATPYGWKLLALPATSATYAAQYIGELRPITLERLTTINFNGLLPNSQTLFNVIVGATGIALIVSVLRKRLRISHLMLVGGGVIGLLVRGERATFEFALFALPLLRTCVPRHRPLNTGPFSRGCAIVLGIVMVACPLTWLHITFGNPPKYPLSRAWLPQGVVTFLTRIEAKGSVLNSLNSGGYLEWMLYPRYKILADMDAPFFFTDEDVFTAKHLAHDGTVLGNVLARYDPSFVTMPISLGDFPELLRAFPDYQLVFFDDAEALYVNARHYPDIAMTYGVRTLNPYLLLTQGPGPMLRRMDRVAIMNEARRLLDVDPECRLTNQLVSVIYSDENAYDRALTHAQAIVRAYPESPTGYGLSGDALQGLSAFQDAVASYRRALRRTDPEERREVSYQLGVAYQALGQYGRSYAALRKAVNPFAPDVRPEELAALARSALEIGNIREANMLARFATMKVPARAMQQRDQSTMEHN